MQTFPWQTLIRAIIKIASGWFLSRGILIDDSWAEITSSALAALISTLWGWWEKHQTEKRMAALRETIDGMIQI